MNNIAIKFSKTKKTITDDNPPNNIMNKTYNNTYNNSQFHFSNLNPTNTQPSFNNKSNIQINNENIFKINKSIKEGKEKIENILSPVESEIKKEETIQNEFQINTTMNQLNKIKTAYNINCLQINNEFIQLKDKKNKLFLVYNSLYSFKLKLLNKEKEIKKREEKITKKENDIKMKENIIKNKFDSFNNYINYETDNLMNKYKNLKNYHQKREEDLFKREEKIKEYEKIVKNIILKKEKLNE